LVSVSDLGIGLRPWNIIGTSSFIIFGETMLKTKLFLFLYASVVFRSCHRSAVQKNGNVHSEIRVYIVKFICVKVNTSAAQWVKSGQCVVTLDSRHEGSTL
jgi:hypothetical protein